LIVVDASIAVKWIVDEPERPSALFVRDLSVPLVAPDLMLAEFANVMRRKLRTGEVTSEQVRAGIALIKSLIDEFVPTRNLIEQALELSSELDHSTYDCIYLACAINRGFLLTADAVFLKKASHSRYADLILALGDLKNGRATALLTPISTGAETLREIERLAPLVVETAKAVVKLERGERGGVKLSSIRQKLNPDASPAAIALQSILVKLSENEGAELLALGQLGAGGVEPKDWPAIAESSRTKLLNFSVVGRLSVSNVSALPEIQYARVGLKKLRAHFGIKEE
jgi:predicted nucleic acid-binding protein